MHPGGHFIHVDHFVKVFRQPVIMGDGNEGFPLGDFHQLADHLLADGEIEVAGGFVSQDDTESDRKSVV